MVCMNANEATLKYMSKYGLWLTAAKHNKLQTVTSVCECTVIVYQFINQKYNILHDKVGEIYCLESLMPQMYRFCETE